MHDRLSRENSIGAAIWMALYSTDADYRFNNHDLIKAIEVLCSNSVSEPICQIMLQAIKKLILDNVYSRLELYDLSNPGLIVIFDALIYTMGSNPSTEIRTKSFKILSDFTIMSLAADQCQLWFILNRFKECTEYMMNVKTALVHLVKQVCFSKSIDDRESFKSDLNEHLEELLQSVVHLPSIGETQFDAFGYVTLNMQMLNLILFIQGQNSQRNHVRKYLGQLESNLETNPLVVSNGHPERSNFLLLICKERFATL